MSKFANKISTLGIVDLEKVAGKGKAVFLDVQPATPANIKGREAGESDKHQSDVVYRVMKPIVLLSKVLGLLPINRESPSKFSFNIASGAMLYCAGMFALMLVYIVYIQFDKVHFFKSAEGRFEEVVIEYLFYTYLIPVVLVPLAWYEAGKVTDCFNLWLEFERMYHYCNGRSLRLQAGRRGLLIAIFLPLIGSGSMVVIHLTMVQFKVVQVIPYCIVNTVMYLVAAYWFVVCSVIGRVAARVSEDFHTSLRNVGPSSKIAEYRSLWLRLTKITRDTGFASCYSMIFMCLYLFMTITLSIYGLLSQIQSGLGLKDVGLTITASLSIALLYFICDQAHEAASNVREDFQKKLLTIELSWMNEDAQQEISMFIRATEMNPTELSLGGFFDVTRSLFKSLMATMVTYLVVLLQFQISIPEDPAGTPGNATAPQ